MDTYYTASDAMFMPFEPKTPCRVMETRPCSAIEDEQLVFPTKACDRGQCARFEKRN